MTSREIYEAAITFQDPPRIAMDLPKPYPCDVIYASRTEPAVTPLAPQAGELRRWRDEWGATWAALTEFDKGQVVAPAIADWSDLDRYVPPDLGSRHGYQAAADKFATDTEHYRLGVLPGFTFNVARKLRTLEEYFCDLALYREQIDKLHQMVRDQLLAGIDRLAEAGADGITFPEDWGTQDRLMVSPEMWREIFRPEFEALAGRAHEHGLAVRMHSCGKMTCIIDDLIQCGVNVLQFDQPCLHGIDTLAEFAGRVSYQCPVDIQRTLQTADPDLIRGEAREMIEKLGAGGGFIAGYYDGNEAIGITPDIQDIACKAFVEFGSST